MNKFKAMIPVLFAMSLAACAGSQNTRSTGAALDDAAITAKVKEKIAATSGIGDAAAINVDTYRGVVSLAGFVNTADEVRGAADVAAQVSGVERVVNNLQLKSPPTSSGQ